MSWNISACEIGFCFGCLVAVPLFCDVAWGDVCCLPPLLRSLRAVQACTLNCFTTSQSSAFPCPPSAFSSSVIFLLSLIRCFDFLPLPIISVLSTSLPQPAAGHFETSRIINSHSHSTNNDNNNNSNNRHKLIGNLGEKNTSKPQISRYISSRQEHTYDQHQET